MTPNLKALADDGARGSMRPSFPSLTYPNHYTLVTGKRPDRNGVVGNEMEDAVIGGPKFVMNGPTSNDPRWWNQAKPFWVSAEQQGKKSAAMFWPGSETAIDGVRPSHWMKYQHDLPYDARIDQVLAWMDSADGPPLAFATLYFDAADTEGHHYGPDSPELTAALVELDRCIGRLVEGLKARGRFETTDLIIVADHGMAPLPAAHRVVLDDLIDVAKDDKRLVTFMVLRLDNSYKLHDLEGTVFSATMVGNALRQGADAPPKLELLAFWMLTPLST